MSIHLDPGFHKLARRPGTLAGIRVRIAPTRSPLRGLAALVAAVVLLVATIRWTAHRMQPPDPIPADAPAGAVSGVRAMETLHAILPDDTPHPLGSAANARVRLRIVDRLRAAGLQPDVQRLWHVDPSTGLGVFVHNILARVPGQREAAPVLVSAHYDSVLAGPGASNNGASVAAAIEVARALRESPPLGRPVTFLFADGGEEGQVGARAHVQDLARRGIAMPYASVVNVDAGGAAGPNLLLRAAPKSGRWVSAWAAHAPQPLGSSLLQDVTRTWPQPSELDVYTEAGLPGLHFSVVGDRQRDGTASDRAANVSPATVQQTADNILAAVRGAAEVGDGETRAEGVWFDVASIGVVRLGSGNSLRLLGAAMLVAALALVLSTARGTATVQQVYVGAFVWIGAMAAGLLAIVAVEAWMVRRGALDVTFTAFPWLTIVCCAAAGLAAVMLAGIVGGRFTNASGTACGSMFALGLSGLLAVMFAPGSVYLFCGPPIVAGLLAVLPRVRSVPLVSRLAFVAAVALLWTPPAILLADALGVRPAVLVAGVWMVPAAALLPFVVEGGRLRWILPVAAVAASAVAGWGAAEVPRLTPERPGHMSFTYRFDGDAREARMIVHEHGQGLTPCIAAALDVEADSLPSAPWDRDTGRVVRSERVAVPEPSVESIRINEFTETRMVRFRPVSRRGASEVHVVIDERAPIRRIGINGTPVLTRECLVPGVGYVLRLCAVPEESVDVEIEFEGKSSWSAVVGDVTAGLPKECAQTALRRPVTRVPVGRGDRTVAWRRIRI